MLVMAWIVATDGPVAVLVLLAVLATCSSTFFYPAIGAYIPNLVRDERELGPANSLWATLDNLGYIIGPALGGILVAVGGAVFAFLANAATFLVIVSVLWRLPPSSNVAAATSAAEPEAPTAAPAGPEAAANPALAVADPKRTAPTEPAPELKPPAAARSARIPLAPIGGLLLVAAVLYAFDGGLGILTVVLATDVLGAGEAATGFLTAAVGIGGVIGGIVSGGLLLRRRLGPPLLIGALVGAAALVLLSNASIVTAAMVGLAMYAFGYFLVDVVITTLLQRVLPDAARGRGVGLLMTVGTIGEVVGSLALPVLVSTLGVGILAPASLILVGAAIVGLRLIGPAATRAPTEAEATLLRVVQDSLFAGIGAPAIERALGRLRTIPVTAGQIVVHQGEPADHFYLVQRGTLAVSQRDAGGRERELRTLGPDSFFGELGLLSGAPRSATVTATADGSLLVLDGPDFLELVGGGAAVRARLLGQYARPGVASAAVGS